MLGSFIRLIRSVRHIRDTDWIVHENASGPIMRRRHSGKWETRPMTDGELENYLAASAW
jgi:hypothetical protein